MTVTATKTGSMVVHVTASCLCDTKSRTTYLIINVNGSDQTITERLTSAGEANQYGTIAIIWKGSVTSGQIVKIRMKCSGPASPVATHTINNAILEVDQ